MSTSTNARSRRAPSGPPAAIAALGTEDWLKQPGASDADIARAEQALGFSFPRDYRQFLRWSDGGEGSFGGFFLELWATHQIVGWNQIYRLPGFAPPNVLAIGRDEHGECLALDYRGRPTAPRLVLLPFMGLVGPGDEWVLGSGFVDGLARIAMEAADEHEHGASMTG